MVQKADNPIPLLFIHGAFTGAWTWSEHIIPWFDQRGYAATALDLPGHGSRDDVDRLQDFGIDDYADAVIAAIDALDAPPVLIGHSMGGYVAQCVAGKRDLTGLVLVSSVPPTGLAAPTMTLAAQDPGLWMSMSRMVATGEVDHGPSPKEMERLVFGESSREIIKRYLPKLQTESRKAMYEMQALKFPNPLALMGTKARVIGMDKDALLPSVFLHATAMTFRTQATVLKGMGHMAMLEHDWHRLAEAIETALIDLGAAVVEPA